MEPVTDHVRSAATAECTGVSINVLRHYCELGQQGDDAEPGGRALLEGHRADVEVQSDVMRHAPRLVDHRLSIYRTQSDIGGAQIEAFRALRAT